MNSEISKGIFRNRNAYRGIMPVLLLLTLSGIGNSVYAQAGISFGQGLITGDIGTSGDIEEFIQCSTGTTIRGIRHTDTSMSANNTAVRGMTNRLEIYCASITTDGTTVTVIDSTPNSTPTVQGTSFPEAGIVQEAYCPANQVVQQIGGWDRITLATYPWASGIRLVCAPLQLDANNWVRINTTVATTLVDAGVLESNAPHVSRGPFCSADGTHVNTGFARYMGGMGYDGIGVICSPLAQARFSAAMTFTDFAWDRTLGGSGWKINLQQYGMPLIENDNRPAYANVTDNTSVYQAPFEMYVVPGIAYGAAISQQPVDIEANMYTASGTCLDSGISIINEQDASCTLDVHGRPDISISMTAPVAVYTAYGEAHPLLVNATNRGPGSMHGSAGYTVEITLLPGWNAVVPSLPAGCSISVDGIIICQLDTTLAAAAAPGANGGTVQFAIMVQVDSTVAAGSYSIATAVLNNSTPIIDADPNNDDYDPSNDVAQVLLQFSPSADLAITKTNTPGNGPDDGAIDTVISGTQRTYRIVASNHGPGSAPNAILRDSASTGLINCGLNTPACTVVNGSATCPNEGTAIGELSIVNLQSPEGVLIPQLDADSSIAIEITCTIQ